MINKYKRRKRIVTALQWNGDIAKLGGVASGILKYDEKTIIVKTEREYRIVNKSDWIIFNGDGAFSVLRDKYFKNLYVKI